LREDPARVDLASAALTATLPASKLLRQNHLDHPLAPYLYSRRGKWMLLEAGLELASLGEAERSEYGRRMLHEDCAPAIAELHSSLLFRLLGASRITRDPVRGKVDERGQVAGPDYRVDFGRQAIGVETKAPQESNAAYLERLLLGRAWQSIASLAPSLATGYAIELNAAALRGAFHPDHVDDLFLAAAMEGPGDPAEAFTTSGLIKARFTGASTMLHLDGPLVVDDGKRMQDLIDDARFQLRQLGLLGIVVVDTFGDPSIARQCCAAAHALREDDDVAAVLLVHHDAPGLVVQVVVGPRYLDLPVELRSRLSGAWCGHIHLAAFDAAPRMCDRVLYPPYACEESLRRFFWSPRSSS